MSNLLKSLLMETEVFEPVKDTFDVQSIHNKLDKAADLEEVETVTFGLETDDDKIVKVYVAKDDADAFEEALSKALGEQDNIEDLLDLLSKDFDIVDVEWPDEEEEEDEEGEDGESNDGSESMNDEVDYDSNSDGTSDKDEVTKQYFSPHESLGQRFLSKVIAESLVSDLEKFAGSKIKPGRNTIKGFPVDIKDSDGSYVEMEAVDKEACTGLLKALRAAGFKAKRHGDTGISVDQKVNEDVRSGTVEIGDYVMIAKSQGGGAGEVIDVQDGVAVVEFGGTRKKFKVADLTVKDPMKEAAEIVGMDPEASDFIGRVGNTAYKRLALITLVSLGIPAMMLDLMHKRNPMLVRDLGEKMRELGGANRMKIAQALGINVQTGEIQEDSSSYKGMSVNDMDNDDDADDVKEPTSTKRDLTSDGKKIDWTVKRDDEGLTLSSAELTVEFDDDTAMEIIDAIGNTKVVRVKDKEGDGTFVFSPRGKEYLLKTPNNKEGYRLSAETVDKIVD